MENITVNTNMTSTYNIHKQTSSNPIQCPRNIRKTSVPHPITIKPFNAPNNKITFLLHRNNLSNLARR